MVNDLLNNKTVVIYLRQRLIRRREHYSVKSTRRAAILTIETRGRIVVKNRPNNHGAITRAFSIGNYGQRVPPHRIEYRPHTLHIACSSLPL